MSHDFDSEPLTRIVVACDESGAKGYADRDEAYLGEVGLFAGLFMPAEMVAEVQPQFNALIDPYRKADGKLHITDLGPAEQESLRQEIFGLIRARHLPCFWEAVHVAGFHEVYKNHAAALAKIRAASRSPFKLSGNRGKPSSLHVVLFQGLYSKVLAFCMERERHRLDLEIRTDRVDPPILKAFEEAAATILDFGAKLKRVTAFDPATKTVVEKQIRIAESPEELRLPVVVERLNLTEVGDSDGLVVAADVLANSLNYLFKNRAANELFMPLNDPQAVAAHPLAQSLDAFRNWGEYNFTDSYYSHPKDPTRRK
jgi:hypothetical protein